MKDALLRLLMVAGWTAVLPLVGFSIFGILTIIPLLGVFLGLELLPLIYAGGAVPAFITATAFELLFRHLGLSRSLIATMTLGALSSVIWFAIVMSFSDDHDWRILHYMNFALAVTGACASAFMPLTRFAKDRRRWR
jgi:hypothetical protein